MCVFLCVFFILFFFFVVVKDFKSEKLVKIDDQIGINGKERRNGRNETERNGKNI